MRKSESNQIENYLQVIIDFLKSKDVQYDETLVEKVKNRSSGKHYCIEDHIRGMVYSMLSNRRKWCYIVPNLPKIDKLFFDYNPDQIINAAPSDLYNGLCNLKCGNISAKKQMDVLADNVRTLQKIEKEYSNLDSFVTSESSYIIVNKLSKSGSPYKLKMMGEALVWEYLRNVGIDGAKPDEHLKRFFSTDRMGNSKRSLANSKEIYEQVKKLSDETGMLMVEIDSLIWSFCADGYGEICTASPECHNCPIREYCKKS